ncbi:cupredoxin family protein [Allohahella marinimesophila]
MNESRKIHLLVALPSALLLASGQAFAHENQHEAVSTEAVDKTQQLWGLAADPGTADQTITISMSDDMRFSPEKLSVREGETVTFKIRNEGEMMHEFVLGTEETLAEHAALMVKFPGMEHSEPYMVHVPPGETGEVNWTFNKSGHFDFACLIAGHYQSGMVGTIAVEVSDK